MNVSLLPSAGILLCRCSECGTIFAYKRELETHMLVHTGVKDFSCDYCNKKFSRLVHKRAHERKLTTFPLAVKKLQQANSAYSCC